MKNKNSMFALAAGILFGAAAFLLLYQKTAELERKTTPVDVLVAARFIPSGSFLKPEMVTKKSIPESFVSPSAIRDLREVEGLSSVSSISSGEQILSNKFGAGEETLASTLNPGYRAYTIEVNETSGVGNLLRPGNHVDLLTKTDSKTKEVTSFVFQNLTVLAVGQKLDFRPFRSGQVPDNSPSVESSSAYGTVTLAVTPEQAETLMYLEGRPLKLVLRPVNDDEIVSIPPQTEAEVMARLGHFRPRTGGGRIEVIHGGSKQGE